MDTFPLTERAWVPVLRPGGERTRVSLRESLLNAGAYERLDAEHPLLTAALHRLHLAVLHRALEGPEDVETAARWYAAGQFDTGKLEAYLERFGPRFELFGPEPFMQVVGLDPAHMGENFRSHWTRLGSEEGSSNTTFLFNPENRPGPGRTDALPAADAALLLLAHQTFVLGGLIKRFTTAARGAPITTAACFLAEGQNLHQTLCLNLVPYPASMRERDLPPWERVPWRAADIQALYAGSGEKEQVAHGYVSRYTWLSRSVLLLPEDGPDGPVVREVGFAAGLPLALPGEGAGANLDPMVALRPAEQPFPYSLRRERLLWRDLDALLPDPAATTAQDRRGKLKVLPGRAPRTLLHAREVLNRLRGEEVHTREAGDEPMNQAAPTALEDPGASRSTRAGLHPVVPVQVYGQLTFQGKAFALRQESYTLPERFIDDPALFRDHLRRALDQANSVGDGLRQSVWFMAHALLKRDGDREPFRGDVTRLAEQIPATPTYWAGLEVSFRTYLRELDGDAGQAGTHWRAALRRAAGAGWRTAEEAAGMNAAGLRAVQVASGPLQTALAALKGEGK